MVNICSKLFLNQDHIILCVSHFVKNINIRKDRAEIIKFYLAFYILLFF